MNTLSATGVGFIIKSFDSINKRVNVMPFSPLFKNSLDSYPIYSYDLSTFDSSKDLNIQLGKLLQPVVASIIANESSDHTILTSFFQNNLNVTVSVPNSAIAASLPVQLPTDNPSLSGAISSADSVNGTAVNFIA